jgi:hypothetical protein
MNFQRSVLIIATVILIGMLTFVGVSINSQTKTQVYPPVVAECPDYWEAEPLNGDPTKPICKNTKNVGSGNCETSMDFNSDEFSGDGGFCSKQKWAKTCGMTWDGVTNSNRKCT